MAEKRLYIVNAIKQYIADHSSMQSSLVSLEDMGRCAKFCECTTNQVMEVFLWGRISIQERRV